jgi:hypothetical protein
MMFMEIIAVYSDNHTKPIHTVDEMQSYWMLKQVIHIVNIVHIHNLVGTEMDFLYCKYRLLLFSFHHQLNSICSHVTLFNSAFWTAKLLTTDWINCEESERKWPWPVLRQFTALSEWWKPSARIADFRGDNRTGTSRIRNMIDSHAAVA